MSTASETGKAGMPYNGAPAAIPGVIEAEEYDLGGKGVAYSDTTPKNIYGVGGTVCKARNDTCAYNRAVNAITLR